MLGFSLFALLTTAAMNSFPGMWLPCSFIVLYFFFPLLIPAFRSSARRLLFAGFLGGGAVSMWFLGLPVPNHGASTEFQALGPFVGVVAPIFAGIVWIIWDDERLGRVSSCWRWAIALSVTIWIGVIASSYAGGVPGGAMAFLHHYQLDNDPGLYSRLSRPVLYISITGLAWFCARTGQANFRNRIFFSLSTVLTMFLFERIKGNDFYMISGKVIALASVLGCLLTIFLLELTFGEKKLKRY